MSWRWMRVSALCALSCACGETTRDSEAAARDPACAEIAAAPLRQIDTGALNVQMSRCGHLSFRDEEQALWLASPALEDPARLSNGPVSDAAFAPDGTRLFYQELEQSVVRSLEDGAELFLAGHAGQLRVVQPLGGELRALACRESGLEILSAELVPITNVDADCTILSTVARGRWALLMDGAPFRVVDSVDGSAQTLPVNTAHAGEYEALTSAMSLSSDGTLLIHRVQVDEPCGDTMCGVKARFTAFSAATGATIADMGVAPKQCCGGFGEPPFLSANTIGHALLIDAFEQMIFLDPALDMHTFTDVTPLHLDATEQRALIRRDAKDGEIAWVKLPGGETLASFARGDDDGWAVAADGSHVAVGQLTERCVRHPTGDSCHTQIWQLSVAAGETLRSVAESSQPLTPSWVGNDGTSLVTGSITLGTFPDRASPDALPPTADGTHLLAADGTRIGSHEIGEVLDVWDTPDALLIKTWGQLAQGFQQALYALSRSSAELRLLVTGDEIEVLLDEARTRMAVSIRHYDGASDRELWAGAVPVP